MRFGEAANPGPPPTDTAIAIGTFNPCGMLGKAPILAGLPTGVWGVTESHLTSQGVQKLRTDMHHQQVAARYHPGHPAAPISKGIGVIGGKATGVGLLSHLPSRSLPNQWAPELWQTGRVQVATAYLGHQWLKVGIAYGYANACGTHSTRDATNELLAALTERIIHQARGPRILMGDFNQPPGQLSEVSKWKAAGFVELQELALQKWGVPIQPTCHAHSTSTLTDYVYISGTSAPAEKFPCRQHLLQ